jgi:hypothetical protein
LISNIMNPNQKVSKLLSVALLAALPLMASMCRSAEPEGPPACPDQAPRPVRATGELVRFEYGITDLQGRPKNCFRQGEDFRLYLYVINQTESILNWNNGRGNAQPPSVRNENGRDSIRVGGYQCRVLGGHIAALDTLIFAIPFDWEKAKLDRSELPYLNYTAKRHCGTNWNIYPRQEAALSQGKYVANLQNEFHLSMVGSGISVFEGPIRYVPQVFKAEIPFTIQ